MDKILESKKGRPTFEETFKHTFDEFLKLRSSNLDFEHLEIRLPVGLMKTMMPDQLPFGRNKPMPVAQLEYTPRLMTGFRMDVPRHKYYPMTMAHVRGSNNSKSLHLSQQFSTCSDRYNKKPLFNPKQYLERKNGYFYRWNPGGSLVTISKLIGTTNMKQIKLQSEKITEECLRFIFLYCQG